MRPKDSRVFMMAFSDTTFPQMFVEFSDLPIRLMIFVGLPHGHISFTK